MKTLFRAALATAFITTAAASATAGELKLTIANGYVTLIAKDVTVREILAEWARVGQTRIINADKVVGAAVTLELDSVPEAQALDTVLRSAAGYVMAPRVAGSPGPSVYDRILILATSRPPAAPPPTPSTFTNRAMPQVQQSLPQDDDGEVGPAGVAPAVVNGPVGAAAPGFPQQQQQQQPAQPQQQQAPMTAPRPGMLPPPPPQAPNGVPNPYLGAPPGPTAPGFNPNPPPPVTTPRGPGGGF